ncbi:MAG: type VI secretion system membrane subunit TssM [Paracoccaceae bacterium]
MSILKAILRFLFSRRLWVFIGVVLVCWLIWQYGSLVEFGGRAPLESDMSRGIAIAVIAVLYLFGLLLAQLRAARRNQMFVAELARPAPEVAAKPGESNVAEINTKFQSILTEMKRSKLGNRKFLRDMPWYLMIGPPGTGKTTALRQSGLNFPIDLSDDIKGVGGTRNCDWFFTEDAVLVDTAGRYVQQASDPEADAAEWVGFLEMLKKHRGKRALNGVIVALSLRELLGPEAELRVHGREIRKRLAELREKLEIQLPVYLMITKTDLIPGFEPFFADLSTREREQVWGATLAPDARVDGVLIEREARALTGAAEARLTGRMAEDATLSRRAEVFRFPAQMERIEGPLKTLIDAVFGESRYEESPWLRGFYLTSATQEGSPIDRLLGDIAGAFGLSPEPPQRRQHGETRSYFLHDLLAGVIFPEAGLGQFDAAAEERRRWIWRGSAAGAALVTTLAVLAFLFSYLRYSGAIDDQARLTADLNGKLTLVAAKQAPADPSALDLNDALEAVSEVSIAATEVQPGVLTLAGPSAQPELARAQKIAYDRTLKNILEPRMVALLEATMWKNIREPVFLLGALKTYNMMTGLADYEPDYIADWWQNALPGAAPIGAVFPNEAALDHQLAAIERARDDAAADRIQPDKKLVAAALESICTIPLSVRAYDALLNDPAVADPALPEWLPAEKAGPNGQRVLTRLSGSNLRSGIPGAFTYAGFHGTVWGLIPTVAERQLQDRAVFAGGCPESANISQVELENDIRKLYVDDYIDHWETFLQDIRIAPIGDLQVAAANLKDLASPESTLKRLVTAVVEETDLTRVEEEGDSAAGDAAAKGALKVVKKAAGKAGKLVGAAAKAAGGAGGEEGPPPGDEIARHFADIKSVVQEVEGNPPKIGDLELAFGGLAAEFQQVMITADPQATLTERGGLPTLLGSLSAVAATLPKPIDAWVLGFAQDTIGVTRDAVLAELNARWKKDVLPYCQQATQKRYPFDPESPNDVRSDDFQKLFGPGGLFDTFSNEQLKQHIDTTVTPWAWRADYGLDPATLAPFELADRIKRGLFSGATGPSMGFVLEPVEMTPETERAVLDLDGQQLVYSHGAVKAAEMRWPGPNGANQVTLSLIPLDGSGEALTSETGTWAWLRLLRKGTLSKTDLPDVFNLRFSLGGQSIALKMTALSVTNPYDMTMFKGFSCPEKF